MAAATLRDDRGAQAMEYAMVGGVGVFACSLLTLLLASDRFKGFLDSIIGGAIDWLGGILPGIGSPQTVALLVG